MTLLNVTSTVSRLFLASAAPSGSIFLARAAARPFSCLVRSVHPSPTQPSSSLLALPSAASTAIARQPSRAIHYKGNPGRRCGSCWIEIIDERMHVFCNKVLRRKSAFEKT